MASGARGLGSGCVATSRGTGVVLVVAALVLAVVYWDRAGIGAGLAKAGAVLLLIFGVQALVFAQLAVRHRRDRDRWRVRPPRQRPPAEG